MPSFRAPAVLRLFPMPSPEETGGRKAWAVDAVETASIDGDSIRLRARDVKGVHAAMRAEAVLRHTGAEGVDRQRVLPPQQFEVLRCDRQGKGALLGGDRGVDLGRQNTT